MAIHGLGAHPEYGWTKESSVAGEKPVNWLTKDDMLPQIAPNARVMQFGYESVWFGKSPIEARIGIIADRLLASLADAREVSKAPLC